MFGVLDGRVGGNAVAVAIVLAFVCSAAILARPAHAETFEVTNTNDVGPGSLRTAIQFANALSGKDTITFDIPGGGVKTITPDTELPRITDPVAIDGYTQPGASPNTLGVGNNAKVLIELSGQDLSDEVSADGLSLQTSDSLVRGLVINRFNQPCPPGCGGVGIVVNGLSASRGGGNVIQGNFVGTNATGTTSLGNGDGLHLHSADNLIGGAHPSQRNVISGNEVFGMQVGGATGTEIQGNYVGTDKSGTKDLGNGSAIAFWGGSGNLVGGGTPGAGNVISGNEDGLRFQADFASERAEDNEVSGNLIGTNATGTKDLGNDDFGVQLSASTGGAATQNTIGGLTPEAANVVSGNGGPGIELFGDGTTSNLLLKNRIGTDKAGTADLGNDGSGVIVRGASYNRIGTGQTGNTVAFNGEDGISVVSYQPTWQPPEPLMVPAGNEIEGNSIFSNAGLGIALGKGGVTTNDPLDADAGPNGLQNFPLLTKVSYAVEKTTVLGVLNSTPNATFYVRLYASPGKDPSGFGEGRSYLGGALVSTNSAGNASFTLSVKSCLCKRYFAATATSAATNDTSEFSPALVGGSDVNFAPTANPDAFDVFKDRRLTVVAAAGVLANDADANGDRIAALLVTGPRNGALTLNRDGSFSYAPRRGFVGTDPFVYRAGDGRGGTDLTTARITVRPRGR